MNDSQRAKISALYNQLEEINIALEELKAPELKPTLDCFEKLFELLDEATENIVYKQRIYRITVRDKEGYLCSRKDFELITEAIEWRQHWIELGWDAKLEIMTTS